MTDEPQEPIWERALAQEIERLRTKAGMSQTQLAKRLTAEGLPFHQKMFQRFEAGERPIRLNEAMILGRIFGTELWDMQFMNDALAVALDNLTEDVLESGTLLGEMSEQIETARAALQDELDSYGQTPATQGVSSDSALVVRGRDEITRAERLIAALTAAREAIFGSAGEEPDGDD